MKITKYNGSDITILLPVYSEDCGRKFEKCLVFLFEQTIDIACINVLVDGPIPEELEIVLEKQKDRSNLQITKYKENRGLIFVLNEGLRNCTTYLVGRIDADDYAISNRFEIQLAFLNSGHDLCGTYMSEYDEARSCFEQKVLPTSDEEIRAFSRSRNPFNHPTMLFKKNFFKDLQYPNFWCEDYALWVMMLNSGAKAINIPQNLVVSSSGDAMRKKRIGLNIVRSELQFQVWLFNEGWIGLQHFIKNILFRIGIHFIPKSISVLILRTLRKNS